MATIVDEIARGGRITVHGDYDVDGVCATAIMVRALRALGADVDWFIPSRLDDGYGLSGATVQRLARRGTRLIVTASTVRSPPSRRSPARARPVSASSSAITTPHVRTVRCPIARSCTRRWATTRARTCAAPAPRTSSPKPWGRRRPTRTSSWWRWRPSPTWCRCAARTAASSGRGCGRYRCTTRPGLRALMAVAKVDPGSLDAGASGSGSRPGSMPPAGCGVRTPALDLLLCTDPGRARVIARELDELNGERRRVEQRIQWEAEAQVAELEAQRPPHGLRAHRRGLAPGRRRDRRLADRRAPPPADADDRRRRRRRNRHRLGPFDPGLRPARRAARGRRASRAATAAIAPPPG